MITRGILLGEIIDTLSTITEQVKTRTKLGLTDINRVVEDFYKEILNKILDASLINCNEISPNSPGIDLIDKAMSLGIQITSEKTSNKINDTIKIINDNDIEVDRVIILMIVDKQKTYTIDNKDSYKVKIAEKDIWDNNDICKKLIGLKLDVLKDVYDIVKKESVRIKIELEIPDEEGNYPTSIFNNIESVQQVKLDKLTRYFNYLDKIEESYKSIHNEVKDDLFDFALKLQKLPRITREFYCFLLERKDEGGITLDGEYFFNYLRLKRLYPREDLHEELMLLDEYGFVYYDQHIFNDDDTPRIRIKAQGKEKMLLGDLMGFIEDNSISLRNIIVKLNFSEFE